MCKDMSYLYFAQIASERASESCFQSSRAKCQCERAKEIILKCEELQKTLEMVVQRDKSNNRAEYRRTLKSTEEEVRQLGASLRSSISIQVSTRNTGLEVKCQMGTGVDSKIQNS